MEILEPSSFPIRRIRSFVHREGRMTKTQSKAWDIFWPHYGVSMVPRGFLDLDLLFGRSSDKIVEIGFGDGRSLIQMAVNAPEKDFIGIDVYRVGIGNLLLEAAKLKVSNLRIICADALEVLEHKIDDNQLRTVQIFFPDPWPKTRHHKRRLIQPYFIDLVARKLKGNGILHLSTDWMDYAYYMMSVTSANDCFINVAGIGEFIPRPDFRPLTKYEQRGLQLGHQTWDLIFKRVIR